jgi:GDP-L-fucose synthase
VFFTREVEMNKSERIFVAGARGLVGSALVRALERAGFRNILKPSRQELDLTDAVAVSGYFARETPDIVIDAAAKVGGILANSTYPAEFIQDNLIIQNNLIDLGWRAGVKKLVFLGSSCIYPRAAPQPIKEEYLLSGPLEPTNEWYAVAKIAGIKMCQAFRRQYGFDAISLMPTNLYGPGDNFNLENSHVLPAMVRKFHDAKSAGAPTVTLWGTGKPFREFLHVDDMADATVYLMESYSSEEIINVGTGQDISIDDLARTVKEVVGYPGKIVFDSTKPDGTPRKLLDVSRLNGLGWRPKISLRDGIQSTYDWFLAHQGDYRA